jgi:hypothetical protein
MSSIFEDLMSAIRTYVGGPKPFPVLSAELDVKQAAHPERLKWRTSIVDLLKLIGRDSSKSAREKMARELGWQGDYNDSAAMNTFLHAAVLRELARN